MITITFEALTAYGGIFASVAAAVAGFLKFRAWWLDRARQSRLESANFFKEKGTEAWQNEFGKEELLRLHFATLSGIDRPSGHEAIRRLQQRLGGTGRAWMLLRGVGDFLITTGHTARIRKPRRRDHMVFAIGIGAAFVAAALAITIVKATVDFAERTPMPSVHFLDLLMIFVAIVWTSALALIAWVAARHGSQYLNARSLSKELYKIRKARPKIARPVSPGPKPELIALVA